MTLITSYLVSSPVYPPGAVGGVRSPEQAPEHWPSFVLKSTRIPQLAPPPPPPPPPTATRHPAAIPASLLRSPWSGWLCCSLAVSGSVVCDCVSLLHSLESGWLCCCSSLSPLAASVFCCPVRGLVSCAAPHGCLRVYGCLPPRPCHRFTLLLWLCCFLAAACSCVCGWVLLLRSLESGWLCCCNTPTAVATRCLRLSPLSPWSG